MIDRALIDRKYPAGRVGVRAFVLAWLVSTCVVSCGSSTGHLVSEAPPASVAPTHTTDTHSPSPTDEPATVAPSTTTRCESGQYATKTIVGVYANYPDLNSWGQFGASVVVVTVDGQPITTTDAAEGGFSPDADDPVPYIVTRYTVHIDQIIEWADNLAVPSPNNTFTLDVGGGTIGCLTLSVSMQPTLRPSATYLMAVVAIPTVDHHMVLDTAALLVNDGRIAGPDSDGYVMDVIKPFIGIKLSDLPQPITVHKASLPITQDTTSPG